MNASFYRRWTDRLARCAACLLPADRASWGEAIKSEVDHIDDHRAALRWAVGALWAAGTERIGALLNTRLGVGIVRIVAGAGRVLRASIDHRVPLALAGD